MVSDSVFRVPNDVNIVSRSRIRSTEIDATSFSTRGSASGRPALWPADTAGHTISTTARNRSGRLIDASRIMASRILACPHECADQCS